MMATLYFMLVVFNLFLVAIADITDDTDNPSKYPNVLNKIITQKLDHFTDDERTFPMQLKVNEQYFKPNSPIFIKIADDLVISGNWDVDFSRMEQLGKKVNAYLVSVERRFQGKSIPEDSTNLDVLKYLTIEQYLEDFVNLIKTLKQEDRFTQSKVIVFGCQWSGNLAAFLRQKYSDVVDGAVVSEVMLTFKPNLPEYFEVLSDYISTNLSEECRDTFKQAFQELRTVVDTNDSDKYMKVFNSCTTQSLVPEDVTSFLLDWTYSLEYLREYEGCDNLKNTTGTALEKFAEFVKFTKIPELECVQSQTLEGYIQQLSAQEKHDYYLTCTQTGLFRISETKNSLFSDLIPATFFWEHFCPALLNSRMTTETFLRNIENTNKVYGQTHLKTTRVLFMYGSDSPYTHTGVTESPNPETPIMLIENARNCDCMYLLRDDDSPHIKEAKERLEQIVTGWV